MNYLPISARFKLPFLIASFPSFPFFVWLYSVHGETTAGIARARVLVRSEFSWV